MPRSTMITLDVYAQARTPAKRAAQRKVVDMIKGESQRSPEVYSGKIGASAWVVCSRHAHHPELRFARHTSLTLDQEEWTRQRFR